MSYVIGNLIGRLLMSAFLVWAVLLIVNRFELSKSLRRLLRPLPIISTIVLLFLGLAGNAVANPHLVSNERQFFSVTTFPEIDVDQIYIPADPHWEFETHVEEQIKTIRLFPTRDSDIAAVVELSHHAFFVPDDQYQNIRDSITESLERSLNTKLKAIDSSNNHLNSISYAGTSLSDGLVLRHQLEVFRSNQRIWTFHTVVAKQIQNAVQLIKNRANELMLNPEYRDAAGRLK